MSLAFQLRWLPEDVDQILFPKGQCDREDGLAAIERFLADAAQKALLKPATATLIVDALVEEDCWEQVLSTTAYPFQFALMVICAMPYRNQRAPLNGPPPVRTLLKRWLSLTDEMLDGQYPAVLRDFTDALFGAHWRHLVKLPSPLTREDLASAMLQYRPPFSGDVLGGKAAATALELPDLGDLPGADQE
jgi:hypothetical protein